MADSTRRYRSPLRQAQADQTRTLILETVAYLLAKGLASDLPVRRITVEAGVSERTVYRYFPDRRALLDGLAEWLTECMGTGPLERALEDADGIVGLLPVVFERFDAAPEITRAQLLLNPDPAQTTEDQRQRTALMAGLVERSFPDLGEPDRIRLAGLVRLLASSHIWLRMREEFGFSGREAGELVGSVLALVFAEVRRTGALPHATPSAPDGLGG